jgi:hypothetical protein
MVGNYFEFPTTLRLSLAWGCYRDFGCPLGSAALVPVSGSPSSGLFSASSLCHRASSVYVCNVI